MNSLSKGDGIRGFLLRGLLGAGAMKAGYMVLGFAGTVLLARFLGAEQYGIYSFAFALSTLLAMPSQMGLPTLVVREVARSQLQEDWGRMRGLLRWANSLVILLSLSLIVLATILLWYFSESIEPARWVTFGWALMLVPLVALGNLRGATLRGLRKVVQGQLPELVLRPAGICVFAIIGFWWFGSLSAPTAMALHVAAAAVGFLAGAVLLWRCLPKSVSQAEPVYHSRIWLHSILPLSLVAGMQVIHHEADIVLLGFLTSDQDVGIYRVALKGAMLVTFGLSVVNMVIAPQLARLHAADDTQRLQRLVTFSSRLTFATCLPLALVMIFYGQPILRMMFGETFAAGHQALAILCLGQLINAVTGPVGYILNMTGHERQTVRMLGLAVLLNLGLNLALIPWLGINGAAIATAVSLATLNMLLYLAVRRQLGIDSLAFPLPVSRWSR